MTFHNVIYFKCYLLILIKKARKIGSTEISTDEVVDYLGVNGFKCLNSAQTDGGCANYEIRVCCNVTTTTAQPTTSIFTNLYKTILFNIIYHKISNRQKILL